MILFRVDANPQTGSGHFMRCRALAQAWRHIGGVAAFASTATLPGEPTHLLAAEAGSAADAEATTALARSLCASWVVLDGYQFPAAFQHALKAADLRLLVIDDHGHAGEYVSDLVLDQNALASADSYAARAATTRLLLGSRYVLLREEFAAFRDRARPTPERASHILITFGGADPVDATGRALNALRDLPDLELTVIVGPQNPRDYPASNRLRILRNVTDMPALIAACDLAISASGSTCWELAFLQTPMLLLPIAENQRPVAAALAARGAAQLLDDSSDLAAATLALVADPARRAAMAAAGRALIDGEGAARVSAHLLLPRLALRDATDDDARRLWEWANDPVVRAVSFSSAEIPWETHRAWFAAQLANPRRLVLIVEIDGHPAGQVRFAREGESDAVISTSLAAAWRGRGFGSAAIVAGADALFARTDTLRIRALIKPDNDASLRAFSRAGFHRIDDRDGAAQFLLERLAA